MYDLWNSKLKKVAQSLFLLSILLARPCEASGPPAIIIVPVLNQTVLFKGTAIFTVVASSGTTMSFQWYKDGVPISGATSSTLTVSDCRDADQGTYTVNITNGGGVVSSSGTLTVLGPPAITAQPVSLMVTQGQTATFSAQATGTSVKYQWYLNGAAVAGATKAALT